MEKILEKVKRMSEKEIYEFMHGNEYEKLYECEKYIVLEAYSNCVVNEEDALEFGQFIETVCRGE